MHVSNDFHDVVTRIKQSSTKRYILNPLMSNVECVPEIAQFRKSEFAPQDLNNKFYFI